LGPDERHPIPFQPTLYVVLAIQSAIDNRFSE